MANFFSLQDGNITDPTIYGYSLSSAEVINNTTGTSLLTSVLYGPSFVSDGSTLNAIALHLSSRQASTSDTISLNANVYNSETNIIDITNNSVVTNVSANVVTDSFSVSGGATSIYFPTSSYLQIPASNYTKFSTNPFTLEFWFKTNTQKDTVCLFSNQNGSDGTSIVMNKIISPAYNNITNTGTTIDNTKSLFSEGSSYNISNGGSLLFNPSQMYLTSNMSIQFWIYIPTIASTAARTIFKNNTSAYSGINMYVSLNWNGPGSHEISINIANSSGTGNVFGAANGNDTNIAITGNVWTHIGVYRNGSSVSVYKNGVQGFSTSIGTGYSIYSEPNAEMIIPGIPFNISNFRVSKTVESTATPAAAYTVTPTTIALLNAPYDFTYKSTNTSTPTKGIYVYNGTNLASKYTGEFGNNQWHHLALVRSSSGSRLFLDGSAQEAANASYASTNFDASTNGAWYLGKSPFTTFGDITAYNAYQGHISNVRAITGTALYTSTFTPSTTKLTNISGTTLLINNTLGLKLSTNLGTYPISGFTSYNGSNNLLTNYPQNWQILKFNPLTSIAGDVINFSLSTSSDNQISLMSTSLTSQDVSPNNLNSYFVGTASLTSTKPYSNFGNSVYVNGSNNYLTIPYNSKLDFGANNFTIECWFNCLGLPETGAGTIFSRWNATLLDFALHINKSTNVLELNLGINGNNPVKTNTGPVIAFNTWYHVAVVRTSSLITLYVNGSAASTSSNISTYNINNSGLNIILGKLAGYSVYGMTGYINDFRVTNGNAVYTSNFTPPSAAPLSYTANTVYLLKSGANFDKSVITSNVNAISSNLLSLDGGVTPYMTSANSILLTKSGTLSGSTDSPFTDTTGLSASYYSNGGALYIPNATNTVNLDNSNYTMEFWVKPLSTGSSQTFIYNNFSGIGNYGWQIDLNTNGNITIYQGQVGYYGAHRTITAGLLYNQWNHVAICNNNGTMYCYVNGSSKSYSDTSDGGGGTITNIFVTPYGGNPIQIGSSSFKGNFTGLRFINGYCAYTGTSITVPTKRIVPYINTQAYIIEPNSGKYYYNSTVTDTMNIHLGSSLLYSGIEPRNIAVNSDIIVDNLFVHNNANLNFNTSNSSLLMVKGLSGIQITSDGTVNIGTSSSPVALSSTHTIVLSNTQIDVHNGGNLNVYGYPKLFTTNLTNDTVSGSRTFTTTDNISSVWNIGDILTFKPNLTSRTGFDTLTLSSFTGANTFTTTTSSLFTHTGSATYANIAGVYNLNRNVKIQGLDSTNRGTIRTIDAANTYINYAQLSNFGINSSNKTGFVLGNNSSGITTLSSIVINSDNTSSVNNITPLTGRTFQNANIINNIINKSNTIVLSSLNISNVNISNNYILSSGGTSLQMNNLSGSINMSNNTTIGSLSYGTYLYNNSLTGGTYGANNFNSTLQGMMVSGSNTGTIIGGGLNSAKEGVYVDASTSTLSGVTFQGILANNNSSVGFKVSGNSLTYSSPVTLNVNGLTASTNNTYGVEAYNITGNISSVTTNSNLSGGIRTSIGNGNITFNSLSSINSGICLNILSGYNYNQTLITNSYLSSNGVCIALDSTRFSKFSIENSTLSSSTPIQLNVTRNLLEGSYLFNNTYMGSIAFIDLNKYQSDTYKSLGFAFMNHNTLSGNNFSYLPAGTKARDAVVYDPATTDNVSERLTPITSKTKLRSSSKFVAINTGDSTSIRANVLVLSTYNGNPPRLILKRNPSAGVYSDMVLSVYDTNLGYGQFFELTGQSPYVIDNSVLEFYVDCDGTSGYVCVDSWFAI